MFCSKCGNAIAAQSKFCSRCGQPVNPTNKEVVTPNNCSGFTLTIIFAINPAVKVVVDGSDEYKIDNGAILNIPISPGWHLIAFSCSIRNKIVNINAVNDVTLSIKWNRVTGSLEVE